MEQQQIYFANVFVGHLSKNFKTSCVKLALPIQYHAALYIILVTRVRASVETIASSGMQCSAKL